MPKPPPAPPRDPMDTLGTIALSVVLLGVCRVGLMFSGLAVVGHPPCPQPGTCPISWVGVGMYLAWAAIAAAVVVTVAGIAHALLRRRTAAVWPAIGIAMAVTGTAAAVAIINAGWGR